MFVAWLGCSGGPSDGETGPETPSETGSAPDPRVAVGEPWVCADPGARDGGPFDRVVLGADWPRTGDPVEGGRGVSIADLDGDGHLDLFVPQTGSASRFLFGDGAGGFADRSDQALAGGLRDAFGASTADVDGDGDADLFVYRVTSPPVIARNGGDGTFTAEAHPEWDPTTPGCGGSGSWGDLDLDGDLDLFYGRLGKYRDALAMLEPCRHTLALNDGAGGFVDASDRLPEDIMGIRVMASGWYDVDDDPFPELYLVVDLPQVLDGNRLVDNDGGVFSTRSGTGLEVDLAGMGLGAGDLNDDGVVDFVVPGIDQVAVLASSAAAGVWVDAAAAWG
ncbi:MAG: FG-GAP-like repeat-containing protein, partial [Myxococcota bacterium]